MRWIRAGLLAAGLASAVAVLAGCSGAAGAGSQPGHPGTSVPSPQASSAAHPSPAGSSAASASATADSRPTASVQPTGAAGRHSKKTVTASCVGLSTDMVAEVIGQQPGTAVATSTPIFSPAPSAVLVCVYGSQSNELVHGTAVTGSAESTLLAGLQGGSASCPANRALYAVLETEATVSQTAWVDLDDCARVLRPDNTIGQASAAALKIIDAVASGH